MTRGDIIRIGTALGLPYNESTNYPDAIKKGTVVFDGCNGQRFLVEASWDQTKIYNKIGQSLILYGRRLKAMEIHNAMSITNDNEE